MSLYVCVCVKSMGETNRRGRVRKRKWLRGRVIKSEERRRRVKKIYESDKWVWVMDKGERKRKWEIGHETKANWDEREERKEESDG